MKKFFYYLSPVFAVPFLLFLLELFDNLQIIKITKYIAFTAFIILSAVFGALSKTRKTYDFAITFIIPVTLFCTMFLIGFFDKSDLGTRFHLYRAFNVSLAPICLILYLITALITLIFSFRKLRIKCKTDQ